MKKRLLSLLLAMCMVLGMLPVSVFAAGQTDYITGAFLDSKGTQAAKVTKSEDTLTVQDYMAGGIKALPVYDIAVPEGTKKVYVAYSGSFSPNGSGDYYKVDGSSDYTTYFSTTEISPYLGVDVNGLLDTGKYLALYNESYSYDVALRIVTAKPELSYELRTLTFEDKDYKGDTNFAGDTKWSSLIDSPQYGGTMLYGSSGQGVSDPSDAYTWYDKGNTELMHTLPYSWNTYCYWGGGHAVSNYVSGDLETYGDYNSQLTVYKAGVSGENVARTGGGHGGSNNFAVHYGYKDESGYTNDMLLPSLSFGDGKARVIDHMYVNNTCYALNCYYNGNSLTANIGEGDWVKIKATGYNGSTSTGSTEFCLVNGPRNIVTDWTRWDLSVLGAVTRVEFNILGSSDNGYGFSQPAYFAYDDVAVRFEKQQAVEVTGIKLDKSEADVNVGGTVTLTATVTPDNAADKTVTWSSSNEAVATVANGVVTGVGRGQATITAKANKATAECVVTVSNSVSVTGVKLDRNELTINRWSTAALTATVSPENANEKTVTWGSSDEAVATVQDGIITAKNEGSATITVKTTDGGFADSCTVTVTDTGKPQQDEDLYYIIDSAEDLKWFADHVNSSKGTSILNAKMTCDIDLSAVVGSSLGNWTPIGNADAGASYGGTFDGGGFTITNLYYKNGSEKYAGIFGHTKGATVKNLTIENAVFERTKSYAAAFIGYAENTTVENCHNHMYIKGTGNTNSFYGGIIGYAKDCIVSQCSNVGCGHDNCELAGAAVICPQPGKIQCTSSSGGIIGYADGTTSVENCFNSGYVYGYNGYHLGGIVGEASGKVTITNCYNTARLATYISGAGSHAYIGGILGYLNDGATADISNCYSNGRIYAASSLADSYRHFSAILAGVKNGSTVTVKNCYYLDSQAADTRADAKTAAEMAGLEFAMTMGSGYQESCSYPVLAWQTATAHKDENKDRKCDVCGCEFNQVPVLIEGVAAAKEDYAVLGYAYNITELQYNQVFTDPDGDTLDYTSYYYERSTDGGKTWSEKANFQPSAFGFTTIQFTETREGTYIYRFYAWDGHAFSRDTYTITLHVARTVPMNFTFYVGKDYSGKYPVIQLYKTAGVDEDSMDYVGWFEMNGMITRVYDPAAYTITGDGENGWKIHVNGAEYVLHDYVPVSFTDSLFGAEPSGEETATASGTVINNYNTFYARIETGNYSVRGYGLNEATGKYTVYLGGQQLILPAEVNVDGGAGGGTNIYLRQLSVFTNSKKTDGKYFTEQDYDIEIMMPIMKSRVQHGSAYIKGNYTYYPFLIYAANNAALFNIVANPLTDGYIFNQTINNTQAAGYTAVSKSIAIKNAVQLTVNVPTGAEFGLYYQWNNFNTAEVECLSSTRGAETDTYVYQISAGNSNYTWRMTDPSGSYVTEAGWLKQYTANGEMTLAFDRTGRKTHDFSGLGTTVATRDEADIQVFLDDSGFLSTSGTHRVRAFRMWQLINSDTANIMVEPDFHVQVLQGNKSDIKQVNGGNGQGNWIDVTPTATDIVAVHYDAIDMDTSNNTTHGGLFPATNPERTGVFVITNEPAGSADAHVAYNRNASATSRSEEWDYNYDTWFYMDTDNTPTLDFTVYGGKGEVAVSCATVTTNSNLESTLSGWSSIAADQDGNYSVDLLGFRNAGTLGGTVIIKMTDSTGTSYRLVRVAQMHVTVHNDSAPGEPFMPGDSVTISFDGLYRSVNKVAGIFNPTTYYQRYSNGETEVNGKLGQYQQMDRASITLTIPENLVMGEEGTTEYSFTNGYVFGSMYSAANPFSTMYNMTDTGVGTNFNAVTVNFCLHRLADITLLVQKRAVFDLAFSFTDGRNTLKGAYVTLTDPDGNVLTPDENGVYQDLVHGTYHYVSGLAGYLCNSGSIQLGSEAEESAVNGLVTKTVTMVKASENAWDGRTMTAPRTDENGVYQISSGAELAWFAGLVNGTMEGVSANCTASAVLTADIDLAGYEWTPIGTNANRFGGCFDGQNHKISNFSVQYSGTSTGTPGKGLFYYAEGKSNKYAVIRNFTIDGEMKLTSSKSVSSANSAAVVATGKYITIENVHSSVDITVENASGNWAHAAGIAAYLLGDSDIIFCSNSGNITGCTYTAGILGYGGEGVKPVSITRCFNTGKITGTSYVAGIAGLNQGTISCCYNTGDITAAGGNSAGIAASVKSVTVTNCFSTGAITGKSNVGAIVGSFTKADGVSVNNYYLEGSAQTGIGTAKNQNTQTADTVSRVTLASDGFVNTMNTGLETKAYIPGNGHPVLARIFRVTPPADLVGCTVTCENEAIEGDDYTFTVEIAVGYEAGKNFAVKVNGNPVAENKEGGYTVENVSSDLTITVEGVEKVVWEPVTVYFSISHDAGFRDDTENGEVMVLQEVSVPYFDLANYGLEKFYFSSESYGDDGDGLPGSALEAGTAQKAYGKVTLLHLYIYATEVYYCGIPAEKAGQGYLLQEGLLGTDVFTITGSQGSSYLEKFWGLDENLNYYVNHVYPLASAGWGSTSDQIILHDGDVITMGHFTSWLYHTDNGGIFNYIAAGKDTVTTTVSQCDKVEMTHYVAGASENRDYTTAHTPSTTGSSVYAVPVKNLKTGDVTQWGESIATVGKNGKFTIDFSSWEPGVYLIAVPGQYGLTMTDTVCSTPGAILVTVTESHDFKTKDTAPSCTEQGYTTHRCENCGYSYVDQYVNAIGHDMTQTKANKATCTKAGNNEYYTCGTCGNVYKDKAGRTQTTVAAETIKARGHRLVTDKAVPATCVSTGLTEGKHCSVCGEVTVKQKTVPATGVHTYANEQASSCGVCGYTKTIAMYRLFNPNSGEHFYTGSATERDNLVEAGWSYEGIAWNAPVRGGVPVHRVFNPNTGDHHYTGSMQEVENLVEAGWKYEGVAWNCPLNGIPVYRLFNPNAECGSHHYTPSEKERDNLIEAGWKYEGVAWNGVG